MRKNKPNRLRKIQLHIMISEAEDQMICERMKRCGYESKSEYIRRMSIDGGILLVDDADLIRQLNYEISKIGNNINQITRVANLAKSVSQEQIDTVKEMMTVIWEYQKKFYLVVCNFHSSLKLIVKKIPVSRSVKAQGLDRTRNGDF